MGRIRCFAVLVVLAGCGGRGSERELVGGDPAEGFRLVRELGCASCHAGAGLTAEPAPRLERVGARLTPAALTAALGGGARMPDCLAGLARDERAAAQAELVHMLASRGGPLAPAEHVFDALTLERGRQLYHSVGCVACHAPFEAPETLARPLWDFEESFVRAARGADEAYAPAAGRDARDLRGIGARTSPQELAHYLEEPLAVHPAGRMPSMSLGVGEAADLAAYLFYEDGLARGAVLAPGPGLVLEYFEGDFAGETVDFDALTPLRTETATSFFEGLVHAEENFGLRFRGLLTLATAGVHRFWTRSDDGSMLYVDGRLVVDNRGQHGMVEKSGELFLEAGRHAFELTYFEHLGDEGLVVEWSGPGFARRALDFEALSHLQARLPAPAAPPFALDPAQVERGHARYEALGCANCHTRDGEGGRPLAELDARRGCLAAETKGAAPRYRFAPGARAHLVAALQAGTPPALTPAERLHETFARLECGACHARDGFTGPDAERRRYFQVEHGLDLGDEGRLPPTLERVGAKLKPSWLAEVLDEGGRVRPYMKTRMPQYGFGNVSELPELFADVDAAWRDEREPEFSAEAVEAGRRLAGTKGLGCIQCHEFAGHPSIGIPAVDLANVRARIHPGWFRELLMDPVALEMNTRMPAFWVDGKSPIADVCGGDPTAQVEALWTYLSLGSSMPLPFGLVPAEGEFEVEVYDTPVCVGVFMAGVSPRTIAVGLPERVHYAFDVEHSRLALAWRGRFLDARGTWYARAGQLEKPAGEDVLEFPGGAPFAWLEQGSEAWPADTCDPLGRSFDQERNPRFSYRCGPLTVTETVSAELRVGGGALVRHFRLSKEGDAGVLHARVATGESIAQVDDRSFRVQGERGYVVQVLSGEKATIVGVEGGAELRLAIRGWGVGHLRGAGGRRSVGWSELEIEYSW